MNGQPRTCLGPWGTDGPWASVSPCVKGGEGPGVGATQRPESARGPWESWGSQRRRPGLTAPHRRLSACEAAHPPGTPSSSVDSHLRTGTPASDDGSVRHQDSK